MRTVLLRAADAVNTGAVDPTTLFQYGQYGVLGLLLACLVFRKGLVPEWTLRRAEEQLEEMREERNAALQQVARLQGVVETQMLPALIQSQGINARYVEELARRTAGGSHAADA